MGGLRDLILALGMEDNQEKNSGEQTLNSLCRLINFLIMTQKIVTSSFNEIQEPPRLRAKKIYSDPIREE
jgi:hypothetical protein